MSTGKNEDRSRIARLEAERDAALRELERRAGDIAARNENETLKAERDALRDGIIRIIQCHNYPLVIEAIDVETGERGPHTIDGYNCADVLDVIHEVFPDFSVWDESRWIKRSTP